MFTLENDVILMTQGVSDGEVRSRFRGKLASIIGSTIFDDFEQCLGLNIA